MKVKLTVFYTDGSSGVIEIDKPPGAHPDSPLTAARGILVAERTGKRVARIGRSKVNPFSKPGQALDIVDNFLKREEVIR